MNLSLSELRSYSRAGYTHSEFHTSENPEASYNWRSCETDNSIINVPNKSTKCYEFMRREEGHVSFHTSCFYD